MPDGITISPQPLPAVSPIANLRAAPADTAPPRAAIAPMQPNPSYRIDAALNIVVIEFIGDNGAVKSSLPTPQQLDAFHRNAVGPNTPRSSLLVKT